MKSLPQVQKDLENFFGLASEVKNYKNEDRKTFVFVSPTGKKIFSVNIYLTDEEWVVGGYEHIIVNLADEIEESVRS